MDTTLLESVSLNLSLLHCWTSDTQFSFHQGESEWQLLEDSDSEGEAQDPLRLSNHDMATAPLLTREAYTSTKHSGRATQYGVLGRALVIQCVYFFIHLAHSHRVHALVQKVQVRFQKINAYTWTQWVPSWKYPLITESHRLPFY
jgi:hypothetical protein